MSFYSRSEITKRIKKLERKVRKQIRCGSIPAFSQAKIDEYEPMCPTLVINEDTGVLNYYFEGTWSEINIPELSQDLLDAVSDAEKHAQETVAFTDSNGLNFDKGAKGWTIDAEAARDEIVDKIDFAGEEEDDILLHDGTNFKTKSISDKDAWLLSAPAYYMYGQGSPGRLFAADNFELRGLTPTTDLLGTTYGSSSVGLGGYLTLDTSGLSARNNSRNFRISVTDETVVSIYSTSISFINDANNYIEVIFSSRQSVIVERTIAGVTTEVLNVGGSVVNGPERFIFDSSLYWDNRDQILGFYYYDGTLYRIPGGSAIPDEGSLNAIGIRPDSGISLASILNYRIELK